MNNNFGSVVDNLIKDRKQHRLPDTVGTFRPKNETERFLLTTFFK